MELTYISIKDDKVAFKLTEIDEKRIFNSKYLKNQTCSNMFENGNRFSDLKTNNLLFYNVHPGQLSKITFQVYYNFGTTYSRALNKFIRPKLSSRV